MSSALEANAKERYEALVNDRNPYLTRARSCAKLTLPYLMPPDGHDGNASLDQPYQTMGARGLRHLSSKLLMTLFPSTAPFFKYGMDDVTIQQVNSAANEAGMAQETARGEFEEALNMRERAVMTEVTVSAFRPVVFEGIRHLLNDGNYLLHIPPDLDMDVRGFRLDSYVVLRDPSGKLQELVIREELTQATAPEEITRLLQDQAETAAEKREEVIELYTHVYLDPDGTGNYIVYQEVEEQIVDGSDGTFTPDKLPYVPIRLSIVEGEDYGRSYVEEYIGDLMSLDVLMQALVEGSAVAAKVVFFANPASGVKPKQVAEAENGDVLSGRGDEITTLQVEKRADFQVVHQQIATLTESLGTAFLLNTSIQRNAERVTAEEIRYMAGELEDGLGGMYSLLSRELQHRIVPLFEVRMEKRKGVPALPKDSTEVTIITGLDALGRGHDLQNLDHFIAGMGQALGPDVLRQYVNIGEYIKRRGVSLGIDMKGLIRTAEEIAQAEQQAQMMAMIQHLGPQGISQAGGLMKQQMAGEQAAQTPPEEGA